MNNAAHTDSKVSPLLTQKTEHPKGGRQTVIHVMPQVSDDVALYHALRRIDTNTDSWGY